MIPAACRGVEQGGEIDLCPQRNRLAGGIIGGWMPSRGVFERSLWEKSRLGKPEIYRDPLVIVWRFGDFGDLRTDMELDIWNGNDVIMALDCRSNVLDGSRQAVR